MPKRSKAQKWFVPVRGSYLPNSWKGWLTYIPFVAFLIFAAWTNWEHYSDHAQAVFIIAADWVAAVVVMTWIAQRTS